MYDNLQGLLTHTSKFDTVTFKILILVIPMSLDDGETVGKETDVKVVNRMEMIVLANQLRLNHWHESVYNTIKDNNETGVIVCTGKWRMVPGWKFSVPRRR